MSKSDSETPRVSNSGRYIFAFLALSIMAMLALHRCDFDLSRKDATETNRTETEPFPLDTFHVLPPLESHPRFELSNLRITVVNEDGDEEYRIDWKITNGNPIPEGDISLLVRLPDDSVLQLPAHEIRDFEPDGEQAVFYGMITQEDLMGKQTNSLSQGCEFFVAFSAYDAPHNAHKLSNSLIHGDMIPLEPITQ